MKDIAKLFISLGLVCCIGCAALVWVNQTTMEPRKEVKAKILSDNLLMVLPAGATCQFDGSKRLEFDGVVFHRAYDNGRLAAVVAETSAQGFGGPIHALVGFDVPKGEIVRVVVTAHTETPGLGTQATDRKEVKSLWRKSTLKPGELAPNPFLDKGFSGKRIGKFRLGKADPANPGMVEAVSGATYSSRGVCKGVKRACKVYAAHEAEIKK